MTARPVASVIIPTYGRPEKLAACVRTLAGQDFGGFEVLIGVDGDDGESKAAAERAWRGAGGGRDGLRVNVLERCGLAAARNALVGVARGDVLISTNDDVLADAGWVGAHVAAQREARERGMAGAVVSGASPWVVHEPDRLFDRLVRDTPMVFFYDVMEREGGADRWRDWGFRHAWGLNLSAPMAWARELAADAGRAGEAFRVYPGRYGYEELEFTFECGRRWGAPVLWRPGARVMHDHRMQPREYLDREEKLGFTAWGFAGLSPACAAAVFGRDVRSEEELAYSRAFVERERGAAIRVGDGFEQTAVMPAGGLGGEAEALVRLAYEQHLLVKRWRWRVGLLRAAEGERGGGEGQGQSTDRAGGSVGEARVRAG